MLEHKNNGRLNDKLTNKQKTMRKERKKKNEE